MTGCPRSFPPASTTRPSCGRARAWKSLYEPVIRRAAGLGVAPTQPDPDRYLQRYAHCDVLVVGAGPAGHCGRARRRAIGRRASCCATSLRVRRQSARRSRARAIGLKPRSTGCSGRCRRSASNPRVTLLARTTAFGYFPHNFIGSERAAHRPSGTAGRPSAPRTALARARAQVVLATGRHRAAAGVSGQRPARHHARRRRADLSEPLRCASRRPGRRRDCLRCRLSGRARPARRGRRGRRRGRPARGAFRRAARGGARAPGSRSCPDRRCSAPRAICGSAPLRSLRRQRGGRARGASTATRY